MGSCRVAIAVALSLQLLFPAPVPLEYDAPTDRKLREKPPLPKLGPAGSIIRDPVFGAKILRVTDERSLPGERGASFRTPSGSFMNPWNSDGTILVALANAGFVPFSFDAAGMKVKRIGGPLPLRGVVFSYREPHILYGMGYGEDDRTIFEYDFRRKKTRKLLELERIVRGVGGSTGTLSVDDSGEKFSVAFGAYQDSHPYIIVWNRATNKYTLLNTREATVDGKPTNKAVKGHGIHASYIDRSGRYVVFENYVWDVKTGEIGEMARITQSGHEASGFGYRINQGGIEQEGVSDCMGFLVRPLEMKRLGEVRQLIWPPLKPHRWGTDGHYSWNNAQPDAFAPVIGSTYRERKDVPLRPWDDEVIGIRTDGKASTVWRFAHHRSVYDGTDFWDTPRGNVSLDGRYFVFTSNWEKTLGKDERGGARQDVFLLELPVGR